jgi:hypothetical protein
VGARLASIWVATLLIACSVFGSGSQRSDADYIAIARSGLPAQAFYAKFAGVDAQVDRSGRLAVDFRTTGARLRVFIDSDRASDSFVECPLGTVRTGDAVAAIRACP